MEMFTKDNGKLGKGMEKENLEEPINKLKLENGLMMNYNTFELNQYSYSYTYSSSSSPNSSYY